MLDSLESENEDNHRVEKNHSFDFTSAIIRLVSPRNNKFNASSSFCAGWMDKFFKCIFWSSSSNKMTFLQPKICTVHQWERRGYLREIFEFGCFVFRIEEIIAIFIVDFQVGDMNSMTLISMLQKKNFRNNGKQFFIDSYTWELLENVGERSWDNTTIAITFRSTGYCKCFTWTCLEIGQEASSNKQWKTMPSLTCPYAKIVPLYPEITLKRDSYNCP